MRHWILSSLICSSLLSCQTHNANYQAAFNAPRSALSTQFRAQGSRDLMGLIQRFHANLVQRDPALIQLKYQAMAEDPFAFYRATAFLFYNDLKSETALKAGVTVPLQGDFHLENMGTYRTSQGTFAYDLNDFDEAVSGPNTWDLTRLAISIHLAGDDVGIKGKDRQALIAHFFKRYLAHLQQIQRQPAVLNQPLDERFLSEKPAEQVQQARQRFDRKEWLDEMTRGGRFAYDDKLRQLGPSALQSVQGALALYARSRPEGAAFLFGIAKRARKYFLGLTTISQDIEDFVNNPYGKPIITNSSLQLLLRQSPAAIEAVARAFNLTDQEKYLLLECGVGEGLFFAGLKHAAIKVIASYSEDQVITTDPAQLLEVEKAKQELEQ